MLTKKQKLVLDKIRDFSRRNGYFPTVREIAAAAGLSSPATVQAYLDRLRRGGALRRLGRSWDLAAAPPGALPPGDGRLAVPLVGMVPAGSPLEMFESLGDEVVLPEWLAEKGGDIVAFRVQGQSMKDAYIQDGDLVLIKRAEKADPGQMVVARLGDGSITLKRLKRDRDAYVLAPENPDYAPITTPFQLVGKVVGVLRRYR
ncbi:MAG: transcriptional repressor LexA [Candidatus Aminicenantes bacterium]|nr:transcriptional repressor LexA [Candidatus Aminicenantes bacterium]